jgi:hypothetical protein
MAVNDELIPFDDRTKRKFYVQSCVTDASYKMVSKGLCKKHLLGVIAASSRSQELVEPPLCHVDRRGEQAMRRPFVAFFCLLTISLYDDEWR